MGIYDRDYTQAGARESSAPGLPVVTKWLLITNIAVYFSDMLFFNGGIRAFGAFAIQTAVFEGRIWEFFTFQFLHGSLGHLLFNMVALYFFAPFMERWWGAGRFLIYYLSCGAAGAVFFSLLVFAGLLPDGFFAGLVGASAGIYGILAGVAVIAPHLRVKLLFPPIELSMRQFAIGILGIAVGSILLRIGGNEGGEAGHLGGALLGVLLTYFPILLGKRRVTTGGLFHQHPRPAPDSKLRPRSRIDLERDSDVDRILDKISQQGFQSLTDRERDILREAAEQHDKQP